MLTVSASSSREWKLAWSPQSMDAAECSRREEWWTGAPADAVVTLIDPRGAAPWSTGDESAHKSAAPGGARSRQQVKPVAEVCPLLPAAG
ncbi:hypothetical protein MRX96_058257 [Rhipicephalus microplus]